MDLNEQQAAGWLQERLNRTVTIMKKEQGDTDRVSMLLRDVAFSDGHPQNPDDYVSDRAIILVGDGAVAADEEVMPLPDDRFEIPVESGWLCRSEAETLHIHTDRADYDISLSEEA